MEESRIESVDQQEDSYFETLKGQAKLDKKEASKMLRKHAANVKEFEGKDIKKGQSVANS